MKTLTRADLEAAAQRLGVSVAHVRAVLAVEAAGSGFDATGQLKRLFEPHLFHRYTQGRFDRSHPHLSYPQWRPGGYGTHQRQIRLFEEARRLAGEAAYLAASWGLGQILGSNATAAGYASARAMAEAFVTGGEPEQLRAFVTLIDVWDLEHALRRSDWKTVARRYNGASYWRHDYDGRLARAFLRAQAEEKRLAQSAAVTSEPAALPTAWPLTVPPLAPAPPVKPGSPPSLPPPLAQVSRHSLTALLAVLLTWLSQVGPAGHSFLAAYWPLCGGLLLLLLALGAWFCWQRYRLRLGKFNVLPPVDWTP